MSYTEFADVYDSLQADVDYDKRTQYLLELFEKYDRRPTLLLDMACGTGGFSLQFAKRGVDVIGVDISPEMLNIARERFASEGQQPLLLCQSASELDLYGTVDGAVCCLDSLNHIIDESELEESFKRISLFLESGRLFIFDVNTEYKHRQVLSGNTFVCDTDDVYCVWNNSECDDDMIVDISLDFFKKQPDGSYKRSGEVFSERAYTVPCLKRMCKNADLDVLAILSDMTDEEYKPNDERIIFIVRKR